MSALDYNGKILGECCDCIDLKENCGAIADGVSGFKNHGINPKNFAL